MPSTDARYAVYGRSTSGSDWQTFKILEIASKTTLTDEINWVKVSGVAWYRDGFFYSRYPVPPAGQEKATINENHQVFFHRLGTAQSDDVLVFEDAQNPQRFHTLQTTEDERFAILTVSDRGKGKDGNALYVADLQPEGGSAPPWPPRFDPLVPDNRGRLVRRRRQRRRRVARADQPRGAELACGADRSRAAGEANWVEVLPERSDPLQSANTAGGKLFAMYLQDVASRAYVFTLDGTLENEIVFPGPGAAGGLGGSKDDEFVFYTFNSLSVPPTIFRYDIATRTSAVFRESRVPGYDPSAFETRQVFYQSKDGTRIPMFLVHKKGIALDGNNPTLLYGYGGFNIVVSPTFSAARLAILERGVVFASANLRGGGEYGEAWHQQGMKSRKQNVFDDFIAAAEWLIAEKYTSPAKLAIQGGSNGGLLVGAVMNQRPELFRAGIAQVGVMDMLRFQKFTIGWNWIADYGSSDDAAEFRTLFAYSPLHNIRPGAVYPATLITTADHDDRVVPAHSFKYAAAMQALVSPERPVLIRIEARSGHGPSNLTKQLETVADIYAFVLYNLAGG